MLERPGCLYVPINVRAMLIGSLEPERKFYFQTHDYAKLSLNPSGSFVPTAIISTQGCREKGVHLHWFLPRALCRGEINADDGGYAGRKDNEEIDFPRIPNRWQIFRLWQSDDTGGQIQMRQFIVESDALQEQCSAKNGNVGSPSLPNNRPGKRWHQYQGMSYPAGQRPKGEIGRVEKLTAVTASNPYYSAYYMDCRNILGFFDDLKDVNRIGSGDVKITYVVCGYYSESDPLSGGEQTLKEWNWRIPDSYTPGGPMLCCGVLDGIIWKGPDARYAHNVPNAVPKIAVGNNTAEALSAMMGVIVPKRKSSERMLQHLLQRNNNLLNEPNGILQSESSMMKNRFGEYSRVERVTIKPPKKDSPIPPEAEALAAEVNRELAEMNESYSQISSMRQTIYDEWYRYLQAAYAARQTPESMADMEKYANEIERRAPSLESQKQRYGAAKAKRDELLARLRKILGSGFTVVEENGQRYWEANAPVLLFSGIGMDDAHDEDNSMYRDGLLQCRTITELTQEISHGDEFCVTGDDILAPMEQIDSRICALVREAALLSESFTEAVTVQALRQHPNTVPDQIAGLVEQIRDDCRDGFYTRYEPCWNPLYMAWKAVFYPDKAVEQPAPSLHNWSIQSNDYVYTGNDILTKNEHVMQGFDILTPHAHTLLRAVSEDELDYRPAKIEAVSQLMSGLHDQFLMIRPGLVMPVEDRNNSGLASKVRNLMECCSPVTGHAIPAFDGYYAPVRAGYLVVSAINIIDSFGQIMELSNPNFIVSEHLRDGPEAVRKAIMLPPRIVQPARLNAEWRDTPERPHLCGWLLPNLIDWTMAVYDNNGRMLGSLVTTDLAGVIWRMPPTAGGRQSDVPNGINPDLHSFLTEIIGAWETGRRDLLTPLMNAVNSAMCFINPMDAQQFNGLGVFLHRPLALVRAGISYELSEPQKPHKFPAGKRPDSVPDLDKGCFPVQIGQIQNHNDGVIGFFEDDDYRVLHLALKEAPVSDPYFSRKNTVDLSVAYPTRWKALTLLMDPVGEANFISGILPVKRKKVRRDLIDNALNNMRYSFFVAPMLTDFEELRIPYPVMEGRTWSFSAFPVLDVKPVLEEIVQLRRANGDALFTRRMWAREGWLNLKLQKEQ